MVRESIESERLQRFFHGRSRRTRVLGWRIHATDPHRIRGRRYGGFRMRISGLSIKIVVKPVTLMSTLRRLPEGDYGPGIAILDVPRASENTVRAREEH